MPSDSFWVGLEDACPTTILTVRKSNKPLSKERVPANRRLTRQVLNKYRLCMSCSMVGQKRAASNELERGGKRLRAQ